MTNQTLTCAKCGNKFIVIEQEQNFLNEKSLPPPTRCPSCRQLRRLSLRGDRQLYKSKCQKCGKGIVVSYNPQKVKQAIYCKEDYEKWFMENDPIIKEPLPDI